MKADEICIEVIGGEVRIDVVAMLKAIGCKDTPDNRDALCRYYIVELRRRAPGMKVVAVQGGGRQN